MKPRKFVTTKIVVLITCIWIFLKITGMIGRQFNDGLNTREMFTVTSINNQFELTVKPQKKGIYIYSASFSYDADNISDGEKTLEFETKFTEKLCASAKILGSVTYEVRDTQGEKTYKGFPRYGKIIKAPLFNRGAPVCLDIEITKIPEIPISDLKLSVSVHNTRPCWLVECLLD